MKANIFELAQTLITYGVLLSLHVTLILCLRHLVRRGFGARNSYRLWALPLLWLPFYLTDWSQISLSSYVQWVAQWLSFSSTEFYVSFFPVIENSSAFSFEVFVPDLSVLSGQQGAFYWWSGFVLFWFSGVAVLAIKNIAVLARFYFRIGKLLQPVPDEDYAKILAGVGGFNKTKMFYFEGINSPAVFGVFKNRLLLPANFLTGFDEEQRAIILSHEAEHVKRNDNFWNLIALTVRTLFWINPLMHLAYRCFRADQELSCDAKALQNRNSEQGVSFAQMLVKTLEHPNAVAAPQVFSSWNNLLEIKERTKMIKQHLESKNRASLSGILIILLTVLGGGLTACVSDKVETVSEVITGAEDLPQTNLNPRTLSPMFFQKILLIQELHDEKKNDEALTVVDELKTLHESGELNPYEFYMTLSYSSNIYVAQDDLEHAEMAYQDILQLEGLDDEQKRNALFSIGNINLRLENYTQALIYFERANELNDEPNNNAVMQMAVTHYQLEQYPQAISFMRQILDQSGGESPENIYRILRAFNLTIGDYVKSIEIQRQIVERFGSPDDVELLEQLLLLTENTLDDDEYLPIVISSPRYPASAASRGIEGWVQVQFTVGTNGEVLEPEIVDRSSTEGIFDDSSLVAIKRFRFKPKMENGEPVEVPGIKYRFTYALSD